MKSLQLAKLRKRAAEASGGHSSGHIYHAALEASAEQKLSGHALDFGAGKGKFTAKLNRANQFSRLSAVDLMPRPDDLPFDVEWKCVDLNDPSAIKKNAYDAIFALEVIEHLENPRATMRQLFSALRIGGMLILTTPNSENIRSYLSLLIKRHFWAFTETSYPEHITALLEVDLRRIGAECGFASIEIDYSLPGGVPKIPRVEWQKVSFGLFKGRLFCDNLMMIARKLG